MARTTYLAPGVYVEEVPSAQQPIAGVGTNTVGFIGLVPNKVQYPVPNPDYDPVIGNIALDIVEKAKAGEKPSESDIAQITEAIESNKNKLDKLKKELADEERNTKELEGKLKTADTEFKKIDKETPPEDPGKRNAFDTKKADARKKRDELETQLAAAIKAVDEKKQDLTKLEIHQKELGDVKEGKLSSPLTKSSLIRPYILEEFDVDGNVDPCETKLCTNFTEYASRFGSFSADNPEPKVDPADPANVKKWRFSPMYPGHRALTHAVYGFFRNGGTRCFVARIEPSESDPMAPMAPKDPKDVDRALKMFESIDELAIIAAPGLVADRNIWDKLVSHCEYCEDRFAILDSPSDVGSGADLDIKKLSYGDSENILPPRNKNAAFYFPHIEVVDPAKQLQDLDPARHVGMKYRGRIHVPPSGHIAGIYASTDEERGVHKAPANCAILGALNVKYYISKPKQELLNPQGVNCIRNMNGNILVWGARTIGGDKNGEWKYVSVRRLFLFLRESIDEGTQWVVFEPNDRALWGKIRRNVSDFLTNVWRSGALFGSTPEEAFYVKCDDETNPPEVRELGQVVTEIGVSIVRPAEFVIFRISQSAGRSGG